MKQKQEYYFRTGRSGFTNPGGLQIFLKNKKINQKSLKGREIENVLRSSNILSFLISNVVVTEIPFSLEQNIKSLWLEKAYRAFFRHGCHLLESNQSRKNKYEMCSNIKNKMSEFLSQSLNV